MARLFSGMCGKALVGSGPGLPMTDSFFGVVVAFCSQKGGVGKSTLAAAMAAAAAQERGVNVRIIDADPLQETSAAWVGRRRAAGIRPDIGIAVADRIGGLRALAGGAGVL